MANDTIVPTIRAGRVRTLHARTPDPEVADLMAEPDEWRDIDGYTLPMILKTCYVSVALSIPSILGGGYLLLAHGQFFSDPIGSMSRFSFFAVLFAAVGDLVAICGGFRARRQVVAMTALGLVCVAYPFFVAAWATLAVFGSAPVVR